MKDDFENVYDMVEHAIELAFEGKMTLKFYDYLKYRKTKKYEVDSFVESSTAGFVDFGCLIRLPSRSLLSVVGTFVQ